MNDRRFKERQVQHLLLLVGRNPLPNAVAASVLLQHGGRITLIHSKRTVHSPGTGDYAKRLGVWLKSPQRGVMHVEPIEIEDSNPTSIFSGVQDALNKLPDAASVGLNYTGGTKAMSVHAYRAVEQWVEKKIQAGRKIQSVFSYLDARTLRMVFDPAHPDKGEQSQEQYVGLAVKVKLEDMLELHNLKLDRPWPKTQPILPDSAKALAEAFASSWAWVAWKNEKLKPTCQKTNRKWKKETDLIGVRVPWPTDASLRAVVVSMQQELKRSVGGRDHNGGLEVVAAAKSLGMAVERFCDWLDGNWLEHWVLRILQDLPVDFQLNQSLLGVNTAGVDFEVDVVGIRGYQLFAFSCGVEGHDDDRAGGRPGLKKKLFEAFIRARQVGGDEARVALVCCSEKPDGLEAELRRDVDPEGHIRVFGRKHFVDLKKHISEWMESQKGKE